MTAMQRIGRSLALAWRRAQKWLHRFLPGRRRRGKPDSIGADLNATIARQPGLTCPRCSFRMQITIPALLSGQPIHCPQCLLVLSVDNDKSKEALQALEKLHAAITRAEAMAK